MFSYTAAHVSQRPSPPNFAVRAGGQLICHCMHRGPHSRGTCHLDETTPVDSALDHEDSPVSLVVPGCSWLSMQERSEMVPVTAAQAEAKTGSCPMVIAGSS